jgi:hypothetical protein
MGAGARADSQDKDSYFVWIHFQRREGRRLDAPEVNEMSCAR